MYFMLSGCLPFQSNCNEEITELSVNCDYSLEGVHWSNISAAAKDLIQKILIVS